MYKVGYIKDVQGTNYLGIKFSYSAVVDYLEALKTFINDDDLYTTLVTNQQARDKKEGHTHHMTVINVMEMKKLFETFGDFHDRINLIQSMDILDLEMLGVGKAERDGKVAYFVVCDSSTLDEIRSSLDLPKQNFHITLGFDPKDVFGVSKSTDSLIGL